jgi:hypothetical protein
VYQMQVDLTEPRPLGQGSTHFTEASANIGTGIGAAIHSPSGEACGVALPTAGGFQVAFVSPDGTFGNNTSTTFYPIMTLSLPVTSSAVIGSQTSVGIDLANSVFLDPTGKPYPTEQRPGTLTIGGTLSITNVLPGGGSVPAGTTIAVLGVGFTPSSVVQVTGANVVTTSFVSSNELDVTLDRTMVLDGVAVQVTKGTEVVTYYSYLRATNIGQSAQPLLAAADPMFSRLTYTNASLPWTFGGTVFTGLALQNPTSTSASVTLEVMSASNQVLQTLNLTLPGRSRMTRDLVDFLGQTMQGASTVVIQSSLPIQLLGIHGDSLAGTIAPVVVTAR